MMIKVPTHEEIQQHLRDHLRDHFAGLAMQGLLANPKLQDEILKHGQGWIVDSAWAWADAMLKAREAE